MRKIFTFVLTALIAISALAYDAPAFGSYDLTSESSAKVSSSGRFIVISNGLYAFRLGSGYSFSNGNGLKTQSNQGGFVFCLNAETKLTCTIKHTESNNAHKVSIKVYSISEAQYKEFDDNKDASTKSQTLSLSGLTPSTFTIDIPAENSSFTVDSILAAGYYAVVPTGEKSNTYLSHLAFEGTCTAPTQPLTLDVTAESEDIYVGDEITFVTEGGNGGAITIAGTASETINNNVWVATAGAHTFTATQAKNGDYCAQEATLDITVLEKTPVAAVTVNGPTSGYIGIELAYTATAANATQFEWYVNDEKQQGNDSAKLLYTPAAAGNLSIVCKARNKFNATDQWIASTPVQVSVSKLCGVAGITLTSATTSDPYGVEALTITGDVKAADKDANNGYKIKAGGYYVGIQMSAGTFHTGDIIRITTTTASDITGYSGNLKLYKDKGANLVVSFPELTNDTGAWIPGVNEVTLPAAAEGATAIYLYRTGNDMNPFVKSMEVERPCAASSDANISKLWMVVDEQEIVFAPESDGVTYNIAIPNTMNLAQANVYFTIHPMATANVTSPVAINVPNPGAAANSQQVVVTAEDGTTIKNYTINVTKNAAAGTNAKLSALTVTGYTLTPAFDADVLDYSITKAYSADNPEVSVVTATPEAPGAAAVVTLDADTFLVTVTAEDNVTTLVYKIAILKADARKDLLEVAFSDSIHGFIANGNINVPYLAGNAEPTFVAAKFWNAEGGPTAEMVNGKLIVHGMDGKTAEYTVNYIPVTPMAFTADTVTFDTVPSYIYSVYGWDAEKGVKFAKYLEEANNHRISEGKDRIYIALPAADSVLLYSGSGAERPVKIFVNGEAAPVTKTAKKNEAIILHLSNEKANFISIESTENSGDAGFKKMILKGAGPEPSAIDLIGTETKAVKIIRDGQVYILRDGKTFNILGTEIK